MNKSMKPSRPLARPAQAAVADEASKAVNFVVTRREQLASSIIFNAVAKDGVPSVKKDRLALAKNAVELADALIASLYDVKGREAAGALAVECFGQKADETEKPAE